MSSQYASKLINELKHQTVEFNAAGLLYLLNHLITKKHYPLEFVQKFITSNYSHQAIDWKAMDQQTILSFHHQSINYIEQHQKHWKVQSQKHQQLINDYIQEKKRIKKILKEKSFTKQELIDSYLEQIRRNKTILLKASPQKYHNKKSNTQIPSSQDKYKYQQNIQLLQKRIQIMMDSNQFNHDHHHQNIHTQVSPVTIAQQHSLNQLVEQLQFKINYFQNLDKNSQLEQAFQKKKQLLSKTKSLNRRIKQLFLHYSSQNYDPSLSFQKNQRKLLHIDLRLYLKYFKELKEAHSIQYFAEDQKNLKKLKSNNLTVVFKKYAKNSRQINFLQFLQINYDLFFNKQKAFDHLTEAEILGQTKQKIRIQPHQSLNQFQQELKIFQDIKDVFFNDKVNKIMNINPKYEENDFESQFSGKILPKKPNEVTKNHSETNHRKVGKIIDKTLEDYEKTRNNIHETFSRRHRKEIVQNFQERLNASQNNSIKIIVNKDRKNSIQAKLKQKNGQGKRYHEDIKISNSQNQTNIGINFDKKDVFNQIIKEVDEQNDEDQALYKNKSKIRRGSVSLRSANDRVSRSNSKNQNQLLSKRRSSTGSLKSVFTLPKITRLSQEKIANQSITKTLSYLYDKLGKQQEPKIKKILQIDNEQSRKTHKIQNQYLKEYFSQQSNLENSESNLIEERRRQSKQSDLKPSCKKYREENYSKFMKFS